jgi:superfamily II DNA/RNA helicase
MLLFVDRLAKVLAAVMRDQDCKVIIFAQTKKRVDDFFYTIKRLGYPAFPIHGDKRQQERDRVLQGTRIDRARVDRMRDVVFFVL